ncbi:hypothetical protein ACVWWG_000056 [Bradyrhizobium sp. LB7.2]
MDSSPSRKVVLRARPLDSATAGYSTPGSDVAGCVMEQEFYQGLAQRVRAIAEQADPFTRRRLLDLASQGRHLAIRTGRAPAAGAAHDPAGVDLLRTGRGLIGPPARPRLHVVFGELRLDPQAVQPGAAVPKPGPAHQDEFEPPGDQHLQDRRQRVLGDSDVAGDSPVGCSSIPLIWRWRNSW